MSRKDEDEERPEGHKEKKGKRPQKIDRLRKTKDFQKVFNSGRKHILRYVILYALPNSLNTIRLGLAVSKRIGSAVVRNRTKRLLREAMRQAVGERAGKEGSPGVCGYDIVLIPRRRCIGAKSSDLVPELAGKMESCLK
ncbi:MAG: ribonuclease P protein component [Nitrospirae bacterium]|nr:ribonuclease P protein component [Nitrospirota bacterium]